MGEPRKEESIYTRKHVHVGVFGHLSRLSPCIRALNAYSKSNYLTQRFQASQIASKRHEAFPIDTFNNYIITMLYPLQICFFIHSAL